MKAKRLVLVVLVLFIVALLSSAVSAAEHKIGHLLRANITAEEAQKIAETFINNGKIKVFRSGEKFTTTRVFYDSLTSLIMALNAGDVYEIALPEPVAEYVMNANDGFETVSVVRMMPASLAFGFRKDDDPALRNKFNEALLSMKADGTLAILVNKYIAEAGIDDPEPVQFEKYGNIDTTIRLAVTGDLPPIDFIAPDGTPAGFSTAVIAEIAKRLKINVELVNIDSGARVASLASKRSDVVFWFMSYKDVDVQLDVPEGVVLTEPYYTWNEDLLLKKK